jgi:hypothetical protein
METYKTMTKECMANFSELLESEDYKKVSSRLENLRDKKNTIIDDIFTNRNEPTKVSDLKYVLSIIEQEIIQLDKRILDMTEATQLNFLNKFSCELECDK